MSQVNTPPHVQGANDACTASIGIKGRQRVIGLDIVRCVAILFVIASHFFINTPAHEAVFSGCSMFLQGMGRTLFMVNVPLFLILTGYLNLNKTVTRKYYKAMIAVILSYLFISVVTIFFREQFAGEHMSVIKWILMITDFSAINYAWYIEMWIGLFLLTPFLNIMWKNIGTLRHKHVLLGTLYFLCAFPDMFNRYGVSLVPGYWELVYPCAFFFIGAYIREYQVKIKSQYLITFILGCCLINPVFNALFVSNHSMIQLVGDGNGIIGMPLATACFLLLYKIDFRNKWIRRMLESVSTLSLDMYLASYMFDIMVYKYFKDHYYVDQGQFGAWFFVVVPTVFILSYIFAIVKQQLFRAMHLPTK